MSRKCTICAHKDRDSINHLLVNNESFRNIAKRYGVSTTAVLRHNKGHIHTLLKKSKEATEISRGENLLEEIKGLRNEAKRISDKAERAGDYRTALLGIRERIRTAELFAKLHGALGEQPVNIIVNPQWISLRARILQVLEAYPEARVKLAEVLDNESTNQSGSSTCP